LEVAAQPLLLTPHFFAQKKAPTDTLQFLVFPGIPAFSRIAQLSEDANIRRSSRPAGYLLRHLFSAMRAKCEPFHRGISYNQVFTFKIQTLLRKV
jgi:hypothetical protein